MTRRQRGFTLVELMVSMLIGLLVVAAAGTLFLSNRRVYGTTEAVSRIQENQRAAFEILARDIREAGSNPCLRIDGSYTDQFGIQLAAPDAGFWAGFASGLTGATVGGSDEVTVYSANETVLRVTEHRRPDAAISTNPGDDVSGISAGQPLILCNNDYAVAFAPGSVAAGSITFDASGANCSGKVARPTAGANDCTQINTTPAYCFFVGHGQTKTAADVAACPGGIGESPAYVAVPTSARWMVAANARGGSSLFRVVGASRTEIAEGVTRLRLTYKVGDAPGYVDAATVAAANDWPRVVAVRAQMTFQAARGAMTEADVSGPDGAAMNRTLDEYIVLRNHQDIQ